MPNFIIKPRQTRALITGASVGIGYELARLMAADQINLVLTARNRERLEQVATELRSAHGITVDVIDKDLGTPTGAQEIFDAVGRSAPIDILVNNAGFGVHGALAETDVQKQLQLLQVNMTSLVHLTHLFLPGLLQRGEGRIMNVASIAGYQPGPYMATYYASKAFVLSFSEAVDEELPRDGKVRVTTLCPGPTATEFFSRAHIENSKATVTQMMSASAVAEIGYRAMLAGQRTVITGLRNRILIMAGKFAPRRLATRIAGKMNRSR